MVLYNINRATTTSSPRSPAPSRTARVPGKIQFGSGWWFLDQKDGMRTPAQRPLRLGLLSRFVGMLTDSRSFLSFPRHEYFRRILCNLIGREADRGELPDDFDTYDSGYPIDVVCWAYCMFSSPADFTSIHEALGETCDYVDMKTELLADLASGGSFLGMDIDLSWLEWPDIDLSDLFDWFDLP
jgi:hypothetical protein